jgi:hypothetical protein
MEIEIITTSAIQNKLDTVKSFGILLNKTTSTIKMLHWFVLDHNAHEILGDLYDDLTDLFDKLEEEIIGTCKSENVLFPMCSVDVFAQVWDMVETYNDNASIIAHFFVISKSIKDLLTSLEFNNYIANVKSGINNTKEDIISRFNKAEYLISMVKI